MRKSMCRATALLSSLVLSVAWTAQAAAQATQVPGSLLVFHEYDNRPGAITALTLTNYNPTAAVRVRLEFNLAPSCQRFDRTVVLTPADTVTFSTLALNPNPGRGFVVAYAVDDQDRALAFNYLVGQSLWIDGVTSLEAGANAVTFEGLGNGTLVDLNNDGVLSFDGYEYSYAPRTLQFPRFLGQGSTIRTDLVLVDLFGGPNPAVAEFLVLNDNEEMFSSAYTFDCWTRVPLLDVSGLFDNGFLQGTNHAPNEIFGAPSQEAGWFTVRGVDPVTQGDRALLGVLVERWAPGAGHSASRPFHQGQAIPSSYQIPTCVPGFFTIPQNLPFPIDVSLLVSDPSLPIDCSSLVISGAPLFGVVQVTSNCVVNYFPLPGYSGPDSFFYRVANTAGLYTDPCIVSIEVQAPPPPPVCPAGVSLELWPPNHQYVGIDVAAVAGVTDPAGLPLSVVITAITQDEPVNGPGDGNSVCDGTGVGTSMALIRAERSGRGNGRVYNIHYTATNSAGGACSGIVEVTVPHSQNGTPAADDGQIYDSTAGCN